MDSTFFSHSSRPTSSGMPADQSMNLSIPFKDPLNNEFSNTTLFCFKKENFKAITFGKI